MDRIKSDRIAGTMFYHCCAVGCQSAYQKGSGIQFYRLPTDTERKCKWICKSVNCEVFSVHFQVLLSWTVVAVLWMDNHVCQLDSSVALITNCSSVSCGCSSVTYGFDTSSAFI